MSEAAFADWTLRYLDLSTWMTEATLTQLKQLTTMSSLTKSELMRALGGDEKDVKITELRDNIQRIEEYNLKLQGSLESSSDTSRVLVTRLTKANDALRKVIGWIDKAEQQATELSDTDKSEILYRLAREVRTALRLIVGKMNGRETLPAANNDRKEPAHV